MTAVVLVAGLVAAALGVAAADARGGPPRGNGWRLVFAEEFDGPALDRERWTTCYWWDQDGCTNLGNDELQWYQPEEVTVEDGVLRLTARADPITTPEGDFAYRSGMVTTGRETSDLEDPLGFSFTYGYAEVRARVPAGRGLWPAFWLLPVTHESEPEIDVMEILGHDTDTFRAHLHFIDEDGEDTSRGSRWSGPDFSEGWHTFAIDWRPGSVTWYVDGVPRWRFDDVEHIPREPLYLLLNLAVGGDYPGSPDASTVFPATYEIDHVRVWRQTPCWPRGPRWGCLVEGR